MEYHIDQHICPVLYALSPANFGLALVVSFGLVTIFLFLEPYLAVKSGVLQGSN
jgi:hypothetical protein